ncbi:MAG: transketolase family protein [Clostridia bacterium]|nr:transketolase family protein [Clostridia bacterium]
MMMSTRKAYGEFLVELGAKNENVIVFDADLAKATCTDMFREKYPDRHFDVGIAEQDLVGISTGAALSSKTVFASSFAMFLCGRAYEQVRNTVGYNHANISLCATHAGLAVGEDGPTHQCIEDISLMRGIPGMNVLVPCDEVSTKKILNLSLEINGPKYIRLGRNDTVDIYNDSYKFELGKSHTFGEGTDGTIFAIGNTVAIALEAQKLLRDMNKDVRVVDLYSIKPVDKEEIIKCALETEILVSIEDHSIIGGIGSLISEVLCEYYPKKLTRLGVQDKFGKSGNYQKLYEMYGITKESIIKIFK